MNHLTKLFAMLVLLAWGSSVTAQNVTYNVISDDPYDTRPLQVHLSPFYAEAWGVNTTIGWEAWATLDVKKRFSFMGSFRKAYLDINGREHVDGELPKPKNGLSKLWRAEAIGMFNFSDHAKKRPLKVTLESHSYTSGGYRYTSSKFIMVNGTKRNVWALRGGIYNIHTAIDFGDMKVKKNGQESIPFTAIRTDGKDTIHFGAFGVDQGGGPIYNGYSMVNIGTFVAGINFKGITNLVIQADGWGTRSNAITNDFYLDFLVAPVIAIKDVMTADKSMWSVQATNKVRTGWRFGWQYHTTRKVFMSFKSEIGQRPGLNGGLFGKFFIDLNMGFNIPFKIKTLMADSK